MYEAKDAALRMLRDAESRITRALEQLPESRLDEPFPDDALRGVFPSIRHFLTQVLVATPVPQIQSTVLFMHPHIYLHLCYVSHGFTIDAATTVTTRR